MSNTESSSGSKKKEIFTYKAPWTTYTMAWRRSSQGRFQLAVGSFVEEYVNQFHVVQLDRTANDGDGQFNKLSHFDHPYPATKVMFAPSSKLTGSGGADLLATTGDYLRLWDYSADDQVTMKGVLNNNKNTGDCLARRCSVSAFHPIDSSCSEYCAPLTSFDWNETDPSILGSCSIDTTCTIWDINVSPLSAALPAELTLSFLSGRR
jgi:WD repeat-containing protein 68